METAPSRPSPPRIQHAIARGELQLAYHPIVRLPDRTVQGVEALLRWNHPTRGLLWPSDFMDAADVVDDTCRITAWVAGEAFAQAAAWHADFPGHPISVTMNLGASDLVDEGLPDVLAELRHQHTLQGAVGVEVPEVAIFSGGDTTRRRLEILREAGDVSVLVDGFGKAYTDVRATLSHYPDDVHAVFGELVCTITGQFRAETTSLLTKLDEWPIDLVKVDRALMEHVFRGREHPELLSGLVMASHRIGFQVLAAGIESDSEAQLAQELGFDFAQGYAFHRPQTADSVAVLLREHTRGTPGSVTPPTTQPSAPNA